MKQTVLIKGNKYGITVNLDPEEPFDALLKEAEEKFRASSGFFKKARVALSVEGRKLTQEEELQLLHVITEQTELEIVCILSDKDDETALRMKEALEAAQKNREKELNEENTESDPMPNSGQFYKGTLRSGQVVESESSIVIMGDINPGAKVIARGNIVILGSLKGYAYAGTGGNTHTFVAALEMNPMQIRIGDVLARNADETKNRLKLTGPHVAYVQDGNIYIEEITKDVLNEIEL